MAKRNEYWDVIRGVAIIAVVTIHAANYGLYFDDGGINHQIALGVRQLVNFAVATFFVLSGYFVSTKSLMNPLDFWRGRAVRLLPPYLAWTAIYMVIMMPGDFLNPALIVKHLITGTGVSIGYYVIVLLQMVALTPFLNAIKSLRSHAVLMIGTTAVGLACTYAFQLIPAFAKFSQFPYNTLLFLVWCPFYQLGFVISKFKLGDAIQRTPRSMFWSLYAAAIGLSFVEAFVVWGAGASLSPSQLKLTSIMASIAVALLVFRYAYIKVGAGSFLSKLGQGSYFIYLSHLLIFAVVEPVLRSIPAVAGNQPLYLVLLVSVTIAALWMTIEAAKSLRSVPLNRTLGLA